MVAEVGDEDALGVEGADLPVDPVAGVGVAFDPADHRGDRGVVSLEDLATDVAVSEGEQDGHALACRAGDVEPAVGLVGVLGAKGPAGSRVLAGHEGQERLLVDRVPEMETGHRSALPAAGRFASVEVVAELLLDVIGAGVATLEGGGPGGHEALTLERVHSSVSG